MKKAIFTLQHNEQFFLPIWVKYYSQFFAPEDMYILAHNCSGKTLDLLKGYEKFGIKVLYLETEEIFNHDWLLDKVHTEQRELLNNYDYVVFTDCDEFIVPTGCTLGEFIDQADQDAYRCEGYDVVEDKMFASHGFSKTLISRVPLTYCHGYHFTTPEYPKLSGLNLYHLHFMDYQECWDKCQRQAQETWDSYALVNKLGFQNRIVDKDEFDRMFYANKNNFVEQSDSLKVLLNSLKDCKLTI